MADEKKTTPKSKAAKDKQKKMYIVAGLGAVVVYYLYTKYKANQATAATSTGAPTSSVDPYANGGGGVGVPGSSTPTSTGPSTVTDPSIDPATGQTYASELAALQSQVSNVNPGGPIQGVVTPATTTSVTAASSGPRTLSQWKGAAQAQLVKFGVSPTSATKSVNQYLNGQAISDPLAAHGLSNIISPANSLGAPPVTHGAAPTVRAAKTKTAPVNVAKTSLANGPQTRKGGGGTLVHGL
jgi:hypothetical protein